MDNTEELDSVLKAIKLSAGARRVYMELLSVGECTASRLSSLLGMPRASVYDQLSSLKDKMLVCEKSVDGKTYFLISGLAELESILSEGVVQSANALNKFKKIKNSITITESGSARIKFYESTSTIAKTLSGMLLSKSKLVCSVWPYDQMLEVLGSDILEKVNDARILKNINLKVIWPHAVKKKKSHIWESVDRNLERRYAPATDKFTLGYILYDNKVTFISSKSEGYAFTIESQEFATLMQYQFHAYWQVCKS